MAFYRRFLTLTCVEGVPWIPFVHSHSNPLGHNLLLSFINWTPTVLGESIVSNPCLWIHVAEKNSATHDRLDVDTGVAEIRRPSNSRNCAIHNHCCHPGAIVMREAGAVPIAMLQVEGRGKGR